MDELASDSDNEKRLFQACKERETKKRRAAAAALKKRPRQEGAAKQPSSSGGPRPPFLGRNQLGHVTPVQGGVI